MKSTLYLIVRHTLKASGLRVEVTFLVANCPDNLLVGKANVALTVTESILQSSKKWCWWFKTSLAPTNLNLFMLLVHWHHLRLTPWSLHRLTAIVFWILVFCVLVNIPNLKYYVKFLPMYPDTLHLTWHQVDRDSDPLVVVVNPIPATDSVAKDILWWGFWAHLAVGSKVSQDDCAFSVC